MGSQTLSPTPAYRGQPEVQSPLDRDAAFLVNPARLFALYLGALLLFLRVSMLNMVLSYLTRINFRLLYIVGCLPFWLSSLSAASGGLSRAGRRIIGSGL